MTDIPDKLTPVPELDSSILPSWIADVGSFTPPEKPDGFFMMTARGPGDTLFHIEADLASVVFDDTFWQRFADPMVNCLGMSIFHAEHPDGSVNSRAWEWRAAAGDGDLTEYERKVIARREELTWKAPVLTDGAP